METERVVTNLFARWMWVLALMVCIFIASGRGSVAAPHITHFDKIAHFSIFGLLATLIGRAIPGPPRRRWWAILIVSILGASDEFRQSFTPGRSVEVADWLADTLGAATAITVYQLWPGYRNLLRHTLPLQKKSQRKDAPVGPPASTAA